MNKILAIAGIAVRNAIRSRIVLLLLGFLVLVIFGLPLTIKGDGTLGGYVQILLGYTFGLVSVILSLSTVWAGCAAVSLEIEERQIHLVVTKPVHRLQIWLGKWTGLLFLNLVLLTICAITTYGLLRWTTRAARLTPEQQTTLHEEILTARRTLHSEPVNVDAAARNELDQARARGSIPPSASEADVLAAIKQHLLTQAFTVPPGATHAWIYNLPGPISGDRPLLFRFRFSSSLIGPERIPGQWSIQTENSAQSYEFKAEHSSDLEHSFLVPAAALVGARTVRVEYKNLPENQATALFPPDDGLTLLVNEGSFEANYIRAVLVIFCQLAFLGALGVTAGSLFSMPVASFVSLCLLLIIGASGFIESMAGHTVLFAHQPGVPVASALWDILFHGVYVAITAVVRPLQGPDPLVHIATGQLFPWSWLGKIILIKIVIYGGCLALFSSWVLKRREVALPSS